MRQGLQLCYRMVRTVSLCYLLALARVQAHSLVEDSPRLLMAYAAFFIRRRRVDLQHLASIASRSPGQVPVDPSPCAGCPARTCPGAQWPVQAMALTRVLPVIDLRTALLHERVDGLEAIRRLQRPAQHTVHPEAMQRQGLVEAFRQTAGRGLVPILQLMLERL